ncbi:hypothetical protein HDU67_006839 [Dinochytrium kinnereticum]|nr:hypothetical protein HDU67_006839 [Dinochytrium kinnereticum]
MSFHSSIAGQMRVKPGVVAKVSSLPLLLPHPVYEAPKERRPTPLIYSAVYSGVPVYEMVCKNVPVMRRISDAYINATQILKVAGFSKPRRTKILEKEVLHLEHEKVQGGYGKYQGTWLVFVLLFLIALKRGMHFSRRGLPYMFSFVYVSITLMMTVFRIPRDLARELAKRYRVEEELLPIIDFEDPNSGDLMTKPEYLNFVKQSNTHSHSSSGSVYLPPPIAPHPSTSKSQISPTIPPPAADTSNAPSVFSISSLIGGEASFPSSFSSEIHGDAAVSLSGLSGPRNDHLFAGISSTSGRSSKAGSGRGSRRSSPAVSTGSGRGRGRKSAAAVVAAAAAVAAAVHLEQTPSPENIDTSAGYSGEKIISPTGSSVPPFVPRPPSVTNSNASSPSSTRTPVDEIVSLLAQETPLQQKSMPQTLQSSPVPQPSLGFRPFQPPQRGYMPTPYGQSETGSPDMAGLPTIACTLPPKNENPTDIGPRAYDQNEQPEKQRPVSDDMDTVEEGDEDPEEVDEDDEGLEEDIAPPPVLPQDVVIRIPGRVGRPPGSGRTAMSAIHAIVLPPTSLSRRIPTREQRQQEVLMGIFMDTDPLHVVSLLREPLPLRGAVTGGGVSKKAGEGPSVSKEPELFDRDAHVRWGLGPANPDMAVDARNRTALHWAAAFGRAGVVKALIAAGANLFAVSSAPSGGGLTGAGEALSDMADSEVVEDRDRDIMAGGGASFEDAQTLSSFAGGHGRDLEGGRETEVKIESSTAEKASISTSASNPSVPLLGPGSVGDAMNDRGGEVPLLRAVTTFSCFEAQNFPEVLLMLETTIRAANHDGHTILHRISERSGYPGQAASSLYYLKCVRDWVEAGGFLRMAKAKLTSSSTSALAQNDPTAVDGSEPVKPVKPATPAVSQHQVEAESARMIEALLNAQDDFGETALHLAVRARCRPVVQMLLRMGASRDVAAYDGTLIYDLAEEGSKMMNLVRGGRAVTASVIPDGPAVTVLHAVRVASPALSDTSMNPSRVLPSDETYRIARAQVMAAKSEIEDLQHSKKRLNSLQAQATELKRRVLGEGGRGASAPPLAQPLGAKGSPVFSAGRVGALMNFAPAISSPLNTASVLKRDEGVGLAAGIDHIHDPFTSFLAPTPTIRLADPVIKEEERSASAEPSHNYRPASEGVEVVAEVALLQQRLDASERSRKRMFDELEGIWVQRMDKDRRYKRLMAVACNVSVDDVDELLRGGV